MGGGVGGVGAVLARGHGGVVEGLDDDLAGCLDVERHHGAGGNGASAGDGREGVGGGARPVRRVAGSAAEGVDGGHSGSGIACACGTGVSTGSRCTWWGDQRCTKAGCGSGEMAVGVGNAVQARGPGQPGPGNCR